MKKHAKQSIELDHLNLAPEAKIEVSNLIQSLLAQAQNERKLLEAKNQALMLELGIPPTVPPTHIPSAMLQ